MKLTRLAVVMGAVLVLATLGCGDEEDSSPMPGSIEDRCGPAPLIPVDDPRFDELRGKWNDCAFPNRATKRVEDSKQEAWQDHVSELRELAAEDCAYHQGRRCSEADVDLWVDEYLAREAERSHELEQDYWEN
jgi:hypothetical protein